MQKPYVSVIVPALNAEKTIEDCVKSLFNQKYKKSKYEIIIIDNNSTDNTLRILQKFRTKIKILKELKKGSYSARNKGLKNARGNIIAFTDSDCIIDKNWLLYIDNTFKDKNIKLFGGDIKAFKTDSALLRYCDEFCHTQVLYLKSTIPFFASANMAVRMKDLRQLGGFNEYLKSGGDVEFCSRLIKDKKEIYYEPQAIVRHVYSNSLIELIKKYYYYGKWHKFRRQDLGIHNSISIPSHIQIFANHGIIFLFIRILQEVSYILGLYFGTSKKH